MKFFKSNKKDIIEMDISILKRKNFKPEEFIESTTALENDIDNNIYCPHVLANINRISDLMQEIRFILNRPVIITSGYRCLELNKKIKSKDSSGHIRGLCIDFKVPSMGLKEIVDNIKDKIDVDVCLIEKSWIHICKKACGDNRNIYGYYINNEFSPL